jgi:hypothetical protein
LKRNNYDNPFVKSYFWRTTTQQEIDYVEEDGDKISAYEIKWNENAKFKKPSSFTESYKTDIKLIHSRNFRNFLM